MTPDRIGTPLWDHSRYLLSKIAPSPDSGMALDPTHVALSLDPQKRVELRDRIAEIFHEFGDLTANVAIGNGKYWPDTANAADAVLAVLLGSGGES